MSSRRCGGSDFRRAASCRPSSASSLLMLIRKRLSGKARQHLVERRHQPDALAAEGKASCRRRRCSRSRCRAPSIRRGCARASRRCRWCGSRPSSRGTPRSAPSVVGWMSNSTMSAPACEGGLHRGDRVLQIGMLRRNDPRRRAGVAGQPFGVDRSAPRPRCASSGRLCRPGSAEQVAVFDQPTRQHDAAPRMD